MLCDRNAYAADSSLQIHQLHLCPLHIFRTRAAPLQALSALYRLPVRMSIALNIPELLAEATAEGDLVLNFNGDKCLQLHCAVVSVWSKTGVKAATASGCKRGSEDRHLLQMPDIE